MKTISVSVYDFDELTPDARARAFSDWSNSADFAEYVDSLRVEAVDDFELISDCISNARPDTMRDAEPRKVTRARAICAEDWRNAWRTWAGADMVFAMGESDFVSEIRLALKAYDAMRDLEDSTETDSATYSDSVYGLEAMICDLHDCFIKDLVRVYMRIVNEDVPEDANNIEVFSGIAEANDLQFTADGERWDR